MTPDLRRLLAEKGVDVVFTAVSFRWKPRSNPTANYRAKREFLVSLAGRRKEQFERLLQLGITAARMTARYYCLNGEEFIPQATVATQHGLSTTCTAYVSQQINAVLYSLGYRNGVPVARGPREYADRIHTQIWRTRKARREERARQAEEALRASLTEKLGLPPLAERFPMTRFATLKKLIRAREQGKLEWLKRKHPRAWLAVTLRFGLDDKQTGVYRTLQEVADAMGGISTRERARQLEDRGLELLGIVE